MVTEEEIKKPSTILGFNVWFTADTHLGHKKIGYHCPGRPVAGGFSPDDIEAHDEWLISRWNETVGKKDHVYILGDFTFGGTESFRKYLDRLNGIKWFFIGNHDKDNQEIRKMFRLVSQQEVLIFKKRNYSFLDEDFLIFANHFPMLDWDRRQYGVVNAHGHCHGNKDALNDASEDLRVDVGWDSKLGNHNLVSLEKLYNHFREKCGGLLLKDYIKNHKGF